MSNKIDFEEVLISGAKAYGFWDESYRQSIFKMIMINYKREIIKEWVLVDLVDNGEKILLKWVKRVIPMSDDELKEMYGK